MWGLLYAYPLCIFFPSSFSHSSASLSPSSSSSSLVVTFLSLILQRSDTWAAFGRQSVTVLLGIIPILKLTAEMYPASSRPLLTHLCLMGILGHLGDPNFLGLLCGALLIQAIK
jgi:hypothetical protein